MGIAVLFCAIHIYSSGNRTLYIIHITIIAEKLTKMAQNKYSEIKGIVIHIYNLHYEKGENRMDVASLKTKDWRKEYWFRIFFLPGLGAERGVYQVWLSG